MYKVFYQDKALIFADDSHIFLPGKTVKSVKINTVGDLNSEYQCFINQQRYDVLLVSGGVSAKKIFQMFINMFSYRQAAGGIVKNAQKQYLMIYKYGKWDFPKGHIHKGEKIETAALREVTEETRLTNLTIVKPLPETFHVFSLKGKDFLKKTYWFEIFCEDDRKPEPQLEEGIEEVKWIDAGHMPQILKSTYLSLKELVKFSL